MQAADIDANALIGQSTHCRKCKYDLRGSVVGRCSECGAPFDPANPRSVLTIRSTVELHDCVCLLGSLAACIIVLVLFSASAPRPLSIAVLGLTLAGSLVSCVASITRFRQTIGRARLVVSLAALVPITLWIGLLTIFALFPP